MTILGGTLNRGGASRTASAPAAPGPPGLAHRRSTGGRIVIGPPVQFDEIVAFADLEDAIDRQVKFYSSGRGMRLGFSVAAFLEPDVRLVDEVLAVGNASFQQRCLAKMRDVLSNGTSLVFVSHDLASATPVDVIGPDLPRLPPGIMRQGRLIVDTTWDLDGAPEPVIGAESTTAPRAE